MMFKQKNAQAQIITTVLLILIAIGAIAVVSVFIFSLVSDNLSGTDCFKAVGQFEVKLGDEGATCYDATGNELTVTVERGQETTLNLTGFSVVAGNSAESKAYEENADLPSAGEKRTFVIDVTDISPVETVSLVPIIGDGQQCVEGQSEKQVPAC